MTRGDREFSIVVFGATGDAGRAVCRYLATKQGARPVKWAVAGRSTAKLEALVSSLGGSSAPSVLLADACDASSLLRIAERATLVFSAVGPYSRLGEPMVKACLVARTHWADITGEVFWVGEMEAKHGEAAAAAGVTLTSLCGYDSVPCELSLHVARKALKLGARHSELLDAEAVTQLNVPEGGGAPAGTLLTVLTALGSNARGLAKGYAAFARSNDESAALWPVLRSLLGSLSLGWSPQAGCFTLAHFMFWCNVPVVHRSFGARGANPLRFRDREQLPMPVAWWNLWHLLPALGLYAAIGLALPLFYLAALLPPLRAAAERWLAAYSYQGDVASSFAVLTRVSCGKRAVDVTFACPGDPGIYGTALLAAECSLGLVDATRRGALAPGFTTPAIALGDALVDRLRAAGCTIEAKATQP